MNRLRCGRSGVMLTTLTTEHEVHPGAECSECGTPVPPTVVLETVRVGSEAPEIDMASGPALFLYDTRVCQQCYENAVAWHDVMLEVVRADMPKQRPNPWMGISVDGAV